MTAPPCGRDCPDRSPRCHGRAGGRELDLPGVGRVAERPAGTAEPERGGAVGAGGPAGLHL